MYTKSAADLRHYIIHMYEEECIIYEEVVAATSSFITGDKPQLKMTITGCRSSHGLAPIGLFYYSAEQMAAGCSVIFAFLLLQPYNMVASFRGSGAAVGSQCDIIILSSIYSFSLMLIKGQGYTVCQPIPATMVTNHFSLSFWLYSEIRNGCAL